MMLITEGTLQVLAGGLCVKARVQHPQVKARKDREGFPWVFRYWHDEVQPDGSMKTLRKYRERKRELCEVFEKIPVRSVSIEDVRRLRESC